MIFRQYRLTLEKTLSFEPCRAAPAHGALQATIRQEVRPLEPPPYTQAQPKTLSSPNVEC
jgi:hypothetical protein